MASKTKLVQNSKRLGIKSGFKKYYIIYIMAIPVMVFYLMFSYAPMYGIIMAFKDINIFKGIWASPWADPYGMGIFIKVFQSPEFFRALKNTLIISGLRLVFCFPAPLILALFINEIKNKLFMRGIQTVLYLPRFISWVVVGGLITGMLSTTTGLFNNILVNVFNKSEPISFMTTPEYFRTILIVSDIWKNMGWGSIIFIAAIAGIDPTLYDVAEIDGAGRFRKMWSVTIPCIKSTIILLFILQLSSILNGGFDQVFVLYNPLVYPTGDIIDTFVYRRGLRQHEYGFATAVGLFKSVIGLVLIIGSDKIFKAKGERGII